MRLRRGTQAIPLTGVWAIVAVTVDVYEKTVVDMVVPKTKTTQVLANYVLAEEATATLIVVMVVTTVDLNLLPVTERPEITEH